LALAAFVFALAAFALAPAAFDLAVAASAGLLLSVGFALSAGLLLSAGFAWGRLSLRRCGRVRGSEPRTSGGRSSVIANHMIAQNLDWRPCPSAGKEERAPQAVGWGIRCPHRREDRPVCSN
jgi:hypothetical protein